MTTPPTKFDLAGLTLNGLVVHEIARGTTRLDPEVKAELSSREAPFDETTLDFLNRQLRNGMTEGAYPAAFLDGSTSSAPGLISSLLSGPLSNGSLTEKDQAAILEASQTLAVALQVCQEHNSPAGMFALCRGELDGKPVVAVMKLESQKGLRLVRSDDVMSLEVNPDLFVGNKAKLFKAAVFMVEDGAVRVMICDEQTENRPSHPAAQYFVGELLGCTIEDDLGVRTAKFFETVSRAADDLLESADDRVQVLSAVRSELGSNKKTVDPAEFISANFPEDKKSSVEAYLQRNKIELTRFDKDASRVERFFRRTTFRSEDGPSVIAPQSAVKSVPSSEQFDDAFVGVQLRQAGNTTTMLIRGVIGGVQPRS